jgi:hypothetical protein
MTRAETIKARISGGWQQSSRGATDQPEMGQYDPIPDFAAEFPVSLFELLC